MVNIQGPTQQNVEPDLSENEKLKKYQDNGGETKSYNNIIFVNDGMENVWVEHSKLKEIHENKNLEKPKRGRVIFMQHGLDGLCSGEKQHNEFEVMVAYMTRKGLIGTNGYNYVSFGIATKREATIIEQDKIGVPKIQTPDKKTAVFINQGNYYGNSYYDNIHTNKDGSKTTYGLQQFINTLTLSNNVIIRNEFSSGTLSFAEQLKEYTDIVELFGNFEADVTFVGHSMGGLASINYAIDYHKNNSTKNIDIVTISTPYDNNNVASTADTFSWVPFVNTSVAHRELAGKDEVNGVKGYARQTLEKKWNSYNGKIDLISIGIDAFKKNGDGDGIVHLKSQLNLRDGEEIYKNSIKIFIDAYKDKTAYKLDGELKQYTIGIRDTIGGWEWHSLTPDLDNVIKVVNKQIRK